MANNNNNGYVAQEELQVSVENPMEQFKTEVAAEIGLANYNSMDKGWLASRQNGYVGGNMTKKMVAYAEQQIGQQGAQAMRNVRAVVEVSPEVRQLNEMASQNFNGYLQALQSGQIAQMAQQTGGQQGLIQ